MGEGGYEGLTLVMIEYADDDAQTRRGVIFPSDQMPPMPDPAELPAEESIAASIEPALLRLTFDGEACTYEGPKELPPGPVQVFFHNESDGSAATNMVSIDEGYTELTLG